VAESKKLRYRYEAPRPNRLEVVRDGATEGERLWLAFQVAMHALDTMLEQARPAEERQWLVVLPDEARRTLQRFVESCRSARPY
jgi:hypothetical protein